MFSRPSPSFHPAFRSRAHLCLTIAHAPFLSTHLLTLHITEHLRLSPGSDRASLFCCFSVFALPSAISTAPFLNLYRRSPLFKKCSLTPAFGRSILFDIWRVCLRSCWSFCSIFSRRSFCSLNHQFFLPVTQPYWNRHTSTSPSRSFPVVVSLRLSACFTPFYSSTC